MKGTTVGTRAVSGVVGVVRNAVVGALAWALLLLGVLALALVPVGLGPLMIVDVGDLTRRTAARQRGWAGRWLDVAVTDPAPPPAGGSVWRRANAVARDPATQRELGWLAWQAVAGPAAALVILIPTYGAYVLIGGADAGPDYVVLGFPAVILVLLTVLAALVLTRVHAVVSRWWLAGPGERSSASARISELTRTRASTVDAQAAELRRIERDLHDGAQSRLVSLGMTVGLARDRLAHAPQDADALLAEVQRSVGVALDELRALVRGIHPPVLAERGLPAALDALALAAPVPVRTRITRTASCPAPVESAVYFAAAESFTNISRHAGATHAGLELSHDAGRLCMVITDDGRGGADTTGGSGLRGIRDRVAAFDGIMIVSSPVGGPTEIRVEVPCEPSSPRTRPCSATASPDSWRPTTSP